jgi:hypothetical protein
MNLRIFVFLLIFPAQLLAQGFGDYALGNYIQNATNDAYQQKAPFYLYAPAVPEETWEEKNKRQCEKDLNVAIQSLLNSDGNNSELLSLYYQIAQMKLTAQVLLNNDYSKLTLEELIRNKIKKASAFDEQTFKTRIIGLYEKHGIKKTMEDATKLVEKFKSAEYGKDEKILKGTDVPIMANFIRTYTPSNVCQKDPGRDICLNTADEATLWIAAQMNRSNRETTEITKDNLEPSYVIAHYSGHAVHKQHRAQQALNPKEIVERIQEYDAKVKDELLKMGEQFLAEFEECKEVYPNSECLYKAAMDLIPKNLQLLAEGIGEVVENMPHDLSMKQEKKGDISVPYLTLRNSVRLNMGLDEVFVDKVKTHQRDEQKRLAEKNGLLEELVGHTVAWEKEEVEMCGGQLFQTELKNIDIGGLDWKGIKAGKQAIQDFKDYKANGRGAMDAKNSENGGGAKKMLNLTKKFYIPGPMFRCAPDPVLIPPFISVKSADKKVCCQNKQEWNRMIYLFFTGSTGFHCRAFFGIPYVAEVGVKVGAGIALKGSLGGEPNACETDLCGQISVKLDVSAGLYGEVLSGAAAVQGTVSWQPYASIKQCGIQRWGKGIPPARFNYKIGLITFSGTAKVGWVASYHIVKVLYSSDKNQEHDLAIF